MVRTVLIVDDHPQFRELARTLLEDEGYVVIGEAGDGASALAAVAGLHPDGVLLDLHLPDMDGFALASELTRGDPHPTVVLTSSDVDGATGSLVRCSGAVRFVPKATLAATAVTSLWDPRP
jgi:CheY-like chemotaxis protein